MARKKKATKNKGSSNPAALIENVVANIQSDYIGTFTGENSMDLVEGFIPCTSMAITYAMGDVRKGAIPIGKVTEFFGAKSSAKSLVVYDICAHVQKMGGIAVLIDSESSYHKKFGKYLGIDYNRFIYAHIRTIEEVTDFVQDVIAKIRDKDADCPILVAWDSMAACTSLREDEQDDEDEKSEMGYRAKLMSRQMRKVVGLILREDVAYLVVNQIRKKLGVRFGSPNTTPGGEAVPFAASARLSFTKGKKIKRKKKFVIGHKAYINCEKNKIRPPFASTEINIHVDRKNMRYGIDKWSGMGLLLEADGIVTRKGKTLKLVSNPDIKFTEKNMGEYWEEYILPDIPEDLYETPTNLEEDDEEED